MSISKLERERLENTFPLSTFRGETKRQLVEFVLQEIINARIDELSHVDGLPQCFVIRNGEVIHMSIDKRLGELHHQSNKLSEVR